MFTVVIVDHAVQFSVVADRRCLRGRGSFVDNNRDGIIGRESMRRREMYMNISPRARYPAEKELDSDYGDYTANNGHEHRKPPSVLKWTDLAYGSRGRRGSRVSAPGSKDKSAILQA
jgi:hypothetical protein